MKSESTTELVHFVKREFERLRDPQKAPEMAAYMKTEMPFYGIAKPERLTVYREVKKRFPAKDRAEYEQNTLTLWNLEHREEKYIALYYAVANERYIDALSIPLYERLTREGAWWDLVDEIATHLSGRALFKERESVKPIIESWINDDDMWIRRSALLSQIGHKQKTDCEQLFRHCLKLASEKEFFIRKAIGWALRDYSWTEPNAVLNFLNGEGKTLSTLSRREAAKRIIATGFKFDL